MTDIDFDTMVTDAVPIPKDESLNKLSKFAQDQIDVENEITDLEQRLAMSKERFRFISEGLIPELMTNLNISEFKLSNGFKVTVKPYFTGKITDEHAEEAYTWLEDNGHGSIVKHDLTVQCRMSNDELLNAIRDLAHKLDLETKEKLGIHHSTFSAFLKEQITSGNEVPRELLGVYSGFKTKIGR